jgi:putative transposase
LLAANGENNDQIGKQLGLDRGRVRIWRKRWLASAPRLAAQEEADQDNKDDKQLTAMIHDLLADVPRPGTTPKFSAEQVVQIVALACEDPQHCGRPVSHWTPRELADEATKRGIVQAISPSSVGRFLKSGRSQATSVPLLAARQTRRPV